MTEGVAFAVYWKSFNTATLGPEKFVKNRPGV